MQPQPAPDDGQPQDLLSLSDRALPTVYGYLRSRCGSVAVAEDLAAETFLAAAMAVRRQEVPVMTTAWLVGVARHKLVDHWRRTGREERAVAAIGGPPVPEDPWEARLDALEAHRILSGLGADHRTALTLRYVDELPVTRVSDLMGRSVHATEGLLVRARGAFRRAYLAEGTDRG